MTQIHILRFWSMNYELQVCITNRCGWYPLIANKNNMVSLIQKYDCMVLWLQQKEPNASMIQTSTLCI